MRQTHLLVVSSLSISKGQNPRIALELERLFSENDNITVIQSEYRRCNMSRLIENIQRKILR